MSCPVNPKSNPKSNSRPEVRLVDVTEDRDGQRLDNFLTARLKGVPKSAIYRMIRTGQVRVNGGRCKPDRRLAAGDAVRIPPVRTAGGGPARVAGEVLAQVRAAIVYEDADYLVFDKPSGMAVHAGSGLSWGLVDAVRQDRPDAFVELGHRLDRETSGCLVLALNGAALRHLSAEFRAGQVQKRYLCLLDGVLSEPVVTVDAAIGPAATEGERGMRVETGGKEARTRFTCLQHFTDCTYAEVELFTGRTHQIRVHAAHLGLPLAGDERYAGRASLAKWRSRGLRRLFLHAHHLEFHGASGETVSVSAPLPEALRAVLRALEG
jgi:23S rRNA pseudouridine955/2504/2580 synthase